MDMNCNRLSVALISFWLIARPQSVCSQIASLAGEFHQTSVENVGIA